jgi:ABC-type branched-subunit amino acid transport system substrate-binding protein
MKYILLVTLVILSSCSGIKMLSGGGRKDYYSSDFVKKIDAIKSDYNRGQDVKALEQLNQIDEQTLQPAEKSLRRNLIGVIHFSKKNYEQAIFNFNQALTSSQEDEQLTAQISLNLSSSYFKMGMNDRAYEALKVTQYQNLKDQDFISYHKLRYHLASEIGDQDDVILSLFYALSSKESIAALKSDPLYEVLRSKFSKVNDDEKKKVLRTLEDEESLVAAYFAYLEAEKMHYQGNKDGANDLIDWLRSRYSENSEIKKLVDNFTYKVESDIKMQPNTIGVVLPLSGSKQKYGERALLGLEARLKKEKGSTYKVIVKDSSGSPAVGVRMVEELIENNSVAMIIGGLFSSEALREYEVARKRGVFFISLSQVYTNKDDKDHLLLEVPGSIESQVNQLFAEDTLSYFGKKGAIIYPHSKRGESYVQEFWRRARLSGVDVNGIYSYDSDKRNYADPVKNLLGLKYPRVRQEEQDLWREVYALESRRSARRIQILKPEVQFDWVFIPSFPLEAIQIIPSFNYFDAFNVNLIGGPSWRSTRLDKESYRYKKIHFIGEDYEDLSTSFSQNFYKEYGRKIKIIELRALDSMNMAIQVLSSQEYKMRDQLDRDIRQRKDLQGFTGQWSLDDGVWIKKMSSLHFYKGKINKTSAKLATESSGN